MVVGNGPGSEDSLQSGAWQVGCTVSVVSAQVEWVECGECDEGGMQGVV